MNLLKNKSRRAKLISTRNSFRIWKEAARDTISQLRQHNILKIQKFRETKVNLVLKRTFKKTLRVKFYQWYKQILKIRNLIHFGYRILNKVFYTRDKNVANIFLSKWNEITKISIQKENMKKLKESSIEKVIDSNRRRCEKKIVEIRFNLWRNEILQEKMKTKEVSRQQKVVNKF
jgi:light-regulated signal transduction histidine kinase (bacteriophytochrome)